MSLVELAGTLEASALARTLRGGFWPYPIVNVAHVLGVALLFGAVAVLDLRLAGLWRRVPLATIARPTLAVAAAGFGVAVLSGMLLLVVQATEYVNNPMLYVKFAAIALAGSNAALLHRSAAWGAQARHGGSGSGNGNGNGSGNGNDSDIGGDGDGDGGPVVPRLALAGIASIACWLVAIAAGRMIAYW